MTAGHSPLFRRRRLGEELKSLREAKGLKLQALAAELGWSHAKISRLENAKVRPDLADIMDLLEALGVEGDQASRLIGLARQANQRGWWRAYDEMPVRQAAYAELEAGALSIREFGLVYVPGLLQTVDYIRTRFADRDATRNFDEADAVQGRLQRQRILTRAEPVTYQAILDEAVLRRATAASDVMRTQLGHLVEISGLPNVTLRVLALDAEVEHYSRPLASFGLYTFDDPDNPNLVVAETETSDVQLGDEEDVARYRVMYERLEMAALDEEASSSLIRMIAQELGD